MSAVRSGSSLRSLLLTPERIPDFLIPTQSPAQSPRPPRRSPARPRLQSDHGGPGGSPHHVRLRAGRCPAEAADTDLTTRAAMSLAHVEKVTTPYGFRAVLAASPCTRPRESMFHRNKPVTVVTDTELQDPVAPPPPGRPGARLRPRRAPGLQVMKKLKLLSPRAPRT